MKKLGDLLRSYITRSGYTIYGIAKAADIKRPTLQKVISSGKNPPKGMIEQLLPFLKLSAAEQHELLTIVDIMVSGREVYNQRLYIKGMLEQVSDFLYSISIRIVPSRQTPTVKEFSEPLNAQLFYGTHSVENLIYQMAVKECYQKAPYLKTNIPGNLDTLNKVMTHMAFSCPGYKNLLISHITHLLVNPNGSLHELNMENLKIFSHILPFITLADFGYHAYYFYHDRPLADTPMVAFPYYVIGTDWGVLLSGSCDSGIFFNSKELLLHLHNQFDADLSRTIPFASVYRKPRGILTTPLRFTQHNASLFSMEYQPCFASYLTEPLVRRYIRPDMPAMRKA